MTRNAERWLASTLVAAALATPRLAFAQADEVQVYDGGLAGRGIFNLTLHNNFTPSGLKTEAFPGGVVPDRSFNGVPEWAYGVTRWFEAGLYLPLYTRDKNSGWGLNGLKLRTLFAVPDADNRKMFYGVNVEFSYNAKRWDSARFTSEIRPIIGWHLKPVDIIVNPILDTSYDGLGNLVFAPATRVAYNFSPAWAVAAEEYADFGPLRDLRARREQSHQLFGVVSHTGQAINVEVGLGVGLTRASDKLTLKLILSRDFNKRQPKP